MGISIRTMTTTANAINLDDIDEKAKGQRTIKETTLVEKKSPPYPVQLCTIKSGTYSANNKHVYTYIYIYIVPAAQRSNVSMYGS